MMNKSASSKLSPKKSLQRQRSQRTWTEDEVRSYLDGVFTGGDQDPARAVRLVLEECKSEEKEPCRKAVFEACISALNSDHLHTKVAKEVTGKLLFEVETLSGSSQVELAEMIIKGLKEGHHASLELFPKLLACITAHKSIHYQKPGGGSGEMMGEDHKSHLMNSLFGCRWDTSCVLHVTDTCREIPMSEDELKFLIQKILQMMESLAMSEIPPLVYQLLCLSRKGHRNLVLEGLKLLFDKFDQTITEQEEEPEDGVTSSNRKDLLTTEGTVFVHLTFAIKQDPDLRKEFLKILKVVQGRLSSSELTLFLVSLALSSVCIQRLEDTMYGFFKDVVLKAYKDEERTNSSKWLHEVTEDAVNIEGLIMAAVSRSMSGWEQVVHGSGWDQVVQGLVSVGLYLIENFGPKSSALSQYGTPQRKTCALGSKMLAETFKNHSVVHREVVTQIVNRVMTNAGSHVTHYVDLLSKLMRGTSPMDLMDSLPKLKESLSYIALIPSHAAVPLLTAILPLVQFSLSLRDCLLLVLRKALFSRHVDARKTAVEGYLLLLRKFTVLDSVGSLTDSELSSVSSQVTVEIHGRSHHGNEALCLEILGTLRRALTKQYDVKLSLYEGLYSVFSANTKLAEPILDLLVGHLIRFYEHEADITPPIKLAPCVKMSDADVIGTEPLGHLLRCIQLCVCHYLQQQEDSDDGEAPAIIGEVQQMLTSLVERMVASELDDFELNRSSDFSTSSVGQKNRLFAQIAMGTYETLLDYTFCTGQFSQGSAEQVLKLYKGYQLLADILQDKGSSGGGASSSHGNKRGAAPVHSRLSLQCVVRILKAIFNDQTPNHQQGLSILRESQAFVKYVLGVALQKIHQVHDTGVCDGAFAEHKPDLVFKHCCSLARLMFKQIEVGGARAAKKEKGKSVAMYCLEGFSLLLHTALVRWERGDGFLTAVNPSLDGSTSPSERTHYFIRHLQRVLCSVLDGSCKEWSLKEAQLMVNNIEHLTGTLELGSQELEHVFEWANAQCREHNIDDTPLTKALTSLLLVAAERHKNSVKMIRKLAQDVHYHLGDIDEDVELEATPSFSIVNPRTAASCILGLLFSHVDQVLVGVEWLVGRLKVEAATPAEDNFGRPGTQVSTQSRDLCAAVCERLTHVVVASSDLVQSSVAAGPATEGVLKMVIKLFSSLANLAKYVLDIYQYTSNVPPQFQKLVNLVGTTLSQQVYFFLTFIQKLRVGGGSLESERGKKGGRGKAKTATTGKSSIRKESRSFSNLIYSMEQFEKHLILLDKKAKSHLMEPFKHSMSRDFRIDAQAVGNILDEDEGSTEGEEEDECNPPEAKRQKSN